MSWSWSWLPAWDLNVSPTDLWPQVFVFCFGEGPRFPLSSFFLPSLPQSALSLALKWSAEAVLGTWLAALLGGLPPLSWTPKSDGTTSDGQAVEGVDGKGWYQK